MGQARDDASDSNLQTGITHLSERCLSSQPRSLFCPRQLAEVRSRERHRRLSQCRLALLQLQRRIDIRQLQCLAREKLCALPPLPLVQPSLLLQFPRRQLLQRPLETALALLRLHLPPLLRLLPPPHPRYPPLSSRRSRRCARSCSYPATSSTEIRTSSAVHPTIARSASCTRSRRAQQTNLTAEEA